MVVGGRGVVNTDEAEVSRGSPHLYTFYLFIFQLKDLGGTVQEGVNRYEVLPIQN